MKELQQIIRRVVENPSRPWALATLVETAGSTYRKRGARLLVDSDGGTLGVLSGGCLEEEIGLAGIAAAITAATYHATGVRVRELPIRIENLLTSSVLT